MTLPDWLKQLALLLPGTRMMSLMIGLALLALLWWWRGRPLSVPRRWAAALCGGVVAVALRYWIDVAWRPVADGVGWFVWGWCGLMAAAVVLAVQRPLARSGRSRPAPSAPGAVLEGGVGAAGVEPVGAGAAVVGAVGVAAAGVEPASGGEVADRSEVVGSVVPAGGSEVADRGEVVGAVVPAGGSETPLSRRTRGGPWRAVRRVARDAVVVVAVVLAGMVSINADFAMFPTLGRALNLDNPIVPFSQIAAEPASAAAAVSVASLPAGKTTEDVWQAPADMPRTGTITHFAIPGTLSGVTSRDAMIYLPPAYSTPNPPQLPVLLLLHGQPRSPNDWMTAGRLRNTMDDFAAAHRGLAPIVVMPDSLAGSNTNNPLCSDTAQWKMGTYLEQDVPNWITANLNADPDTTHWAVAGLSNGGTCALQMVTRMPDRFTTFLDMSGESEPSLYDRATTVAQAFAGDEAAFAANNPADLMATGTGFSQVAGIFSSGTSDPHIKAGLQTLMSTAEQVGMQVQWREYPGGHQWELWATALHDQVPWVSGRLRITPDAG